MHIVLYSGVVDFCLCLYTWAVSAMNTRAKVESIVSSDVLGNTEQLFKRILDFFIVTGDRSEILPRMSQTCIKYKSIIKKGREEGR